jgi:type I restriction enzyme S subunit
MPSDLHTTSRLLADVCADVSYGYTESATTLPVGPKFLRITDIQGGRFDWKEVPYCPATDTDAQKYGLKIGDLVVARTGNSTGENAQVWTLDGPAVFASYLIRFRIDPDKANPFFVGYQLRTRRFWDYVLAVRGGSAQPGANAKQLGAFELLLPERSHQDAVVGVLRSVDDRIDLLRQTNATLESIAQALFKSWFIDFDPVRAKAEGREPEGIDAGTAALFPAEFEESVLGLIPKGWGVQRLSDVLELAYGKALKATDRRDGHVPVYGSGGITGFHDEALVQSGSIIVGRKGTVGSLYWEDKPFFPIDTTFYVKPKAAPLTFCFYALQRLGLESMNTDAAVPGLNRENAYRLELISPGQEALRAFDDLGSSLRTTMRCNDERAALLAGLRDTLLPRLISGKLRLPEAQEQLEDALP